MGQGVSNVSTSMLIMLESHQTMQRFVKVIIQASYLSAMVPFSKGLLIILDAILCFGRYLKAFLQ